MHVPLIPHIQTPLSVRSNLQTSVTSPSTEHQNPQLSSEPASLLSLITDRYSKFQKFCLGFLTDYTINRGYGCMTAYHRGKKGVNGGKHGPVYLSSCHWRPEESVWLQVDTNGTTQRGDKVLRHFFNSSNLISFISDTQVFIVVLSRKR